MSTNEHARCQAFVVESTSKLQDPVDLAETSTRVDMRARQSALEET